MSLEPCILFTAFEPSGDEHAAAVIAELRTMLPHVSIAAFGGPRMAEAGATLIESTTDRPAMLAGSLSKVRQQLALRRRFTLWLDEHPVAVHVPTDSPAANWWFCKAVKQRWGGQGAKVAHFVAPQVWAWASWRISRLRKWSDMVLCILPFEPDWFTARGVEARFVGHPLFDHPLEDDALHWQAIGYPGGSPKLALLPGSRPGEITANWPLMLETFRLMSARLPHIQGLIAAADDESLRLIRQFHRTWPQNLKITVGQSDAVIRWADVVLAVSGTITLHVARQRKPMVVLYKVSPVQWHTLGRWLIQIRTFSLPNLLAVGPSATGEGHIVREFIPFFGRERDAQPIADELVSLVEDKDKRQQQMRALDTVVAKFAGYHAGRLAAEAVAHLYHQSLIKPP